jgi:hypothetical protein
MSIAARCTCNQVGRSFDMMCPFHGRWNYEQPLPKNEVIHTTIAGKDKVIIKNKNTGNTYMYDPEFYLKHGCKS